MALTRSRDCAFKGVGRWLSRSAVLGVLIFSGFIAVICHADTLENRIYDLQRGEFIDKPTLIKRLQHAKVVLIGEKHDNSDHHQIEQQLLNQLIDSGTGVVFEMLDSRHQAAIDALYLSDQPDVTAKSLFATLNWQTVKGWPWADYGELFVLAANKGRLIPGNISPEEIRTIYQSGFNPGELDKTLRARLTPPLLDLVFDGHCGKMPRSALGPMVYIQLAKDIHMAKAMRPELDRHLFIIGSVHARRDIGIPQHLPNVFTQAQSVIVMLQQLEPDKTALSQWQDYPNASTEKADYLWFTTAYADRDYCADL